MTAVGGGANECQGSLLEKERRGGLSSNDAMALRAHLDHCGACRLTRQMRADFDTVGAVDLNDGARIQHLSSIARGWAQVRRRPAARRRRLARPLRVMAMAASMVLMAGTVSAAVWLWRHPAPAEPRESARVAPLGGPPRRPLAVRNRVAPPALSPPPPREAIDVVFPRVHRRRLAAESPSASALLLGRAGDARRRGESERAIGLYQKLQQEFPHSSEAVLSSVPLGGLLLERRFPRAALAQFDRYLASSHGGVLIPEALYGRGRALSALGDRQEEQQNWTRLLSDFPDSAYAPLGRRRLSELQ